MIDRREIIDAATATGLNPHVIEKDVVLGWVLAGINAHSALAETWIFKGGTCLKKCFFETYRFSEDLDFTLTDASHIDQTFLKRVFGEISEWVYEQAGFELPVDKQDFDIYDNPRGQRSCQAKLSYRGPVSPVSGGLPRIKLDLTADERVVLPPARVPIFHPYSDAPTDGIQILAYAYEEAFGEKIRALAERTRPRDLYDVINLFRNEHARPSASVLLDVLKQKCAFKGISVPKFVDLLPHRSDLDGGWTTMLAHQLPALPPLESFWNVLPAFFEWLEGGAAPVVPAAYVVGSGETVLRSRQLRLHLPMQSQSFLEIIRFAGSNRLCVDLDYQNSTRRIEPYSLRRTADGNVLLHTFSVTRGEHRSYRVDRITGARITNQTFEPRYEVELTPEGPVHLKPVAGRQSGRGTVNRMRPRPSSRQHRTGSGPTYVYECSYCGKRFYHKTRSSTLRPHRDKSGYPCPGRHAVYIDTRY